MRPGALEVARRVRGGESSAEAEIRAALDRADALEPVLRAFLRLSPEEALLRARSVDLRRESGEALGSLAGVPFAVKGNIAVRGWPLTAASRILEGHVAPVSATVVERLLAADAVPLGTTNLDEFAMGSSCEWSSHGPTRNPWDPGRVPGGSSGGSAAAVASGIVPFALGTDTGGSVRQPAAFCGVVGLRPTWGRVSRSGVVAFASSMDQVGPITTSVEDAAAVLAVISGPDPLDATSADGPVDVEDERGGGVGWLRIEGGSALVEGRIRELLAEILEGELLDVEIGDLDAAVPCYLVLSSCEASTNLSRYDGVRFGRRAHGTSCYQEMVERTRSEGFGQEVKRRILLGTFALSAGYRERYHARADGVRRRLRENLEAALRRFEILALPTAPSGAFRFGERSADPLTMYLEDLYTTPASLAGLPALSIPCGLDGNGMPLGLQLIGRRFGERRLLEIAADIERAIGFEESPTLASRPEEGLVSS